MSDYHRFDQLDDSDAWDEEADDADPMPEAFAEFLLHDARGPKIDQERLNYWRDTERFIRNALSYSLNIQSRSF
jgi:hypothetical protein